MRDFERYCFLGNMILKHENNQKEPLSALFEFGKYKNAPAAYRIAAALLFG